MCSRLMRLTWIISCILLFMSLLGCKTKINKQVQVENPNSGLLAILVKPSDFDNKLSWYTELVGQQTPTNTNERFTEKAYMILDGLDEKKVHLYVEHDLRCYPKLSNLAEVAIITDSDSSSFNKVGIETMASCKTVDVHQSTLATCTIEARYSNLVSTIIIRYEKPNVALIKELGNDILLIIDNRIGDTYSCGQ